MLLLVLLLLAFLLACVPRVFGLRVIYAIAIGSLVVPLWVLISEFILPYRGGGASFWPIAFVVGGAYGFVAACFGTLCGSGIGHLVRTAPGSTDRDDRGPAA